MMNHLQYRNSGPPQLHQTLCPTATLQNFVPRFAHPTVSNAGLVLPTSVSNEQLRYHNANNIDLQQIFHADNRHHASSSDVKADNINLSNCFKPSSSNLQPLNDLSRHFIPAPNNNGEIKVPNKGFNHNFKAPQLPVAASTNTPRKMVDAATMTDPLTPEEQERLGQWEGFAAAQSGNKVAEYLTSLRQFLKLSVPNEGRKRQGLGDVRIVTAPDGSRLYCCSECHMAYPDKTLLEQHLASHKVERRFICTICGAGLKRKEHLDRHQLSHSTDRPYTCAACPKTFKRNEHLARHYIIHSGEKGQICTECGKAFYRRDHLQKHTQGHLTKRLRMAAMAS
ncbi:unnamed protein product [Bemisia tabaci]|uniref:C2H2-type domain-containing protein n=1 Tax=Bemisia tabaci TaxID=7038 RepID=A0A9P0F1H3_BEMTA|nr:unnamed protein product [Bemisia tabaci]